VQSGVKELCLVSQDTSAYGRDLRTEGHPPKHAPRSADPTLAELVQQVAAVDGVHWVRLLYLYPDALSPELLELLAHHERVVPYVDMPMQHASDAMLRRMRRGHGARRLRNIVEQLRTSIPSLTLRSAFIVGHPGETQADFDELREFVQWAAPERLAVFRYSDEAGTRSHTLSDKVPPLVAANRERSLMAVGRRISRRNNRALLGRTLEVLVEGPSDEHPLVLMGRHAGQAPEIDGQVYLSTGELADAPPERGSVVSAIVTQASDYDVVAEPQG
jgi:ribosomal protein S12 methylthiotransferase